MVETFIVKQIPCPACGALTGKWCDEANEVICFSRFEAITLRLAEERRGQMYFADIAGVDYAMCMTCRKSTKGTDATYVNGFWYCRGCGVPDNPPSALVETEIAVEDIQVTCLGCSEVVKATAATFTSYTGWLCDGCDDRKKLPA